VNTFNEYSRVPTNPSLNFAAVLGILEICQALPVFRFPHEILSYDETLSLPLSFSYMKYMRAEESLLRMRLSKRNIIAAETSSSTKRERESVSRNVESTN